MLKKLRDWLGSVPAVPDQPKRVERKMQQSIWVFYESKYGIDPRKDKTIREFLGKGEWYGSSLSTGGERDHSFYWSEQVEARAIHLKNTGVISRIQVFEPRQEAA